MVRTSGFHPGNRSSILRGITKVKEKHLDINPSAFLLVSKLLCSRAFVMDGAMSFLPC